MAEPPSPEILAAVDAALDSLPQPESRFERDRWRIVSRVALDAAIPLIAPSGQVAAEDVDRWTRHLLHTSQHNRMVIGLGGRIQQVVNEMRAAAGLPAFRFNDAIPDAEFGECTVHVDGCQGQEIHALLVTDPLVHLTGPATPCPLWMQGQVRHTMTEDPAKVTCPECLGRSSEEAG